MVFTIVCTGMVLFLGALTGIYMNRLQAMVDEESYEYLEEISAQLNSNLEQELDGNYSTLRTYANKVQQNVEWTLARILKDLDDGRDIYGYSQFALIDNKGMWHAYREVTSHPEMEPYLATMRETRKPVTTELMNRNQKECITLIYPIHRITYEGNTFTAIAASIDLNVLNEKLSLSIFDNQGYSHVVTRTGQFIMRSNNPASDFKGNNLFTHLKDMEFYDGVTLETIRSDFGEGASRKIRYKRADGMDTMAIYTPTGYNDWYLYCVIPTSLLTERSYGFFHLTLVACIVIAAVFLIMLLTIYMTQVRRKRELLRILYTDPVTEGNSLARFEILVRQALRQGVDEYSILYLNVNRFKLLNEQIGRVAADRLLREIYRAIDSSLRDEEAVVRIMADHFGVLLRERVPEQIGNRIEEWNDKMEEYAEREHFPGRVRMTCGVYPIDRGGDVAVLLDRANLARKNAGNLKGDGIRVAVYDEVLEQKVALEEELELRQESALLNREFKMYLQPKYNPADNTIAGAEALVRWLDEKKGMLYPDQYIPLFESNGFIVKLDLFIFEEACRFIRRLVDQGKRVIPISVNLSRVNLNNPKFLDEYVKVWSRYDFPAELLEFEITEGLIFDNILYLNEMIGKIHERGFRVSMDDFGSGYSSLNMLKDVNIDVVKLDREFFSDRSDMQGRSAKIVGRMIELARDLNVTVVAEGVEYEEQVEFLRKNGCDLIQGYYYSKPVPAEEVMAKL